MRYLFNNFPLKNIIRLARYSLGGISPSAISMLLRLGPTKTGLYLVNTGRMRDREFGKGLPIITTDKILKKCQGNKDFNYTINPTHHSYISSNANQTMPNLLVGLIAAAVKPLHALEIGVWKGGGTCQIASQLNEGGSVVTVGPPLNWTVPENRPINEHLTDSQFIQEVDSFLWEGTPHETKIQLIRADSRFLDYSSLNREFDLAFIDGSHSEEAVRQDTERVFPVLAEGAVVLWHDYQSSVLSHGVDRYLHELSKREPWPIYVIEYTTMAIQIRR